MEKLNVYDVTVLIQTLKYSVMDWKADLDEKKAEYPAEYIKEYSGDIAYMEELIRKLESYRLELMS